MRQERTDYALIGSNTTF